MTPICQLIIHLHVSYLHMEFGERLKELRTGLNISQKELSEKTGLTLRTIQRIENNEVKPSLYSVKAISDALELASSELLNRSDTIAQLNSLKVPK